MIKRLIIAIGFCAVLSFVSCFEINRNIAPPKKNATITRWEFCHGCMTTVEEFSIALQEKMSKMHDSGVDAASNFSGADVANNICDSGKIDEVFKVYVQNACYKILGEDFEAFINHWAGKAHTKFTRHQTDIRTKMKKICGSEAKSKPCDTVTEFQDVYPGPDECNSCKELVKDIDDHSRRYRDKDRGIGARIAMESLCSRIGIYHDTTSRLDSICDDLVEDFGEKIVRLIQMRDKLAEKGMKLSSTLEERVCTEVSRHCQIEIEDL